MRCFFDFNFWCLVSLFLLLRTNTVLELDAIVAVVLASFVQFVIVGLTSLQQKLSKSRAQNRHARLARLWRQ